MIKTWKVFTKEDLDTFELDTVSFPELAKLNSKEQLVHDFLLEEEYLAVFSFFKMDKIVFLLILYGPEVEEKYIALIPSCCFKKNILWVYKKLNNFCINFLKEKTKCRKIIAFSDGYELYERWLNFLGFEYNKDKWSRGI